MTDFGADGVVGAITNTAGVAPATGALAVNAQGSPNMTVAVTAGVAYVTATPTGQGSQRLRAKIAAQNATCAANATGGTRYDWIYVKIDPTNANTPAVGGDNVASIVVSRSTSSSTDNGTPPTYGYAIAVVTVANGASSITNGNIADSRSRAGTQTITNSAGTASVAASQTTTSTTYAALATAQTVTVTVGATGILQVGVGATTTSNNTSAGKTYISFALSGANTLAAADNVAAEFQSSSANVEGSTMRTSLLTGLTPGSTTVTALCRVDTGGGGSGTGTWVNRNLWAVPL